LIEDWCPTIPDGKPLDYRYIIRNKTTEANTNAIDNQTIKADNLMD